VLSGEIDVEFDSGQVVTMKQGDIVVMRGVTHTWKNKSTLPASRLSSLSTRLLSWPQARREACSFRPDVAGPECAGAIPVTHTASPKPLSVEEVR